MENTITDKDYSLAIKLLGRTPRTPFSVATKCSCGTPQVLLADPIFKENSIWKPFPTFLWLVCPRLKAKIGALENEGYITKYSNRLQNDAEFRDEFIAGQKIMSTKRVEMASKTYGKELPEHIYKLLTETTIAGSSDIKGVKCLHAHLAHDLAFGGNPIGKEIRRITGECDSSVVCHKLTEEVCK